MDIRDLFLEQHAWIHSAAVGGNKASAAERTFGGLSDEQMRLRPREDLNSLVWLLWHIARGEDVFVNIVLAGREQVFEDGWAQRLGVSRRDFGIGMTSAEVTELSRAIDIGAVREYRDAVGRRTREIIGTFAPQDWEGTTTTQANERAAAAGAFGTRGEMIVKAFSGRPRTALLSGITVFHASGHMGEANTVRTAAGFGLGI
jgi:DinB superfamily